MKRRLSLREVITFILCSTFVVQAIAVGYFYYDSKQIELKQMDPQYNVQTLVQEGIVHETIPSIYLQEILGLSQDLPTNLYSLSLRSSLEDLLKIPVISYVELEKWYPSTLFIRYELRQPIAMLEDYHNILIDKEGVPIPMHPFYSPKKLPMITLGDDKSDIVWHQSIKNIKWDVAREILDYIQKIHPQIFLSRIDLRDYSHISFGKQQIIVGLEDSKVEGRNYYLRLSYKTPLISLENYFTYLKEIEKHIDVDTKEVVVDLRNPDMILIL